MMPVEFFTIDGVRVPRFLFGTAWKEESTRDLTALAIREGFRGVDTANQRRHYYEAAVGDAIAQCIANGVVSREELFLQTKFTFGAGQDHRLPYDPSASITEQVRQSFASSLEHLQTEFVDSYVLHGPSARSGLSSEDWEAWRAMESVHHSGRARLLGVSNVSLEQLQLLCRDTHVRPRFVQNRCFAHTGWDEAVRRYCGVEGIVYQGFSLLTANRAILHDPRIMRIAERYGRTTTQIVFRFSLDIGMIPLTGTSSREHMRSDLDVFDFRLEADEVKLIERVATR